MTAAEHVRYCRRCGAQTGWATPEGDNRPRATCSSCGAIEYDNPKVVVAGALHEGDRILFVRRALAPYAGAWALPAGFVECGETLREAACREVLEETHLKVAPEDLLLYGSLSLPDLDEIYIALAAPLPSHDFRPSAEASELAMLTFDELCSHELGYPPATLELVRLLYVAIADGDLPQTGGRLWDMRGRDPSAE